MIIFGYILIGIGFIGILYTYFLYNILLKIWSGIFHKPVNKDSNYQPDISIVISAYNEEELIERSVRSIFTSNYPLDKIYILIGSDGSTDRTYEICDNLSKIYANIKVFEFERGGKNRTLNRLTPMVRTDIICFMDADVMLTPDTISTLMSNFADPEVGGVISPMVYKDNPEALNAGHKGEKMYQSFESKTKLFESNIYSTVNSLGAFYSIRKELYKLLPNERICDDLTPVLNVNLAGKRMVFEIDTFVIEFRKKSLSNEVNRRNRVVSGGMESILLAKDIFSFSNFRAAFFLFSHKIMRYFTPFFLIFILLGAILNFGQSIFFNTIIFSSIIIALSALLGFILDKQNIKFLPFQFSVYFVLMNYGFLKALITFLKNETGSKWD